MIAKQIFPEELRQRHKLNLLTLPAHNACNAAFQLDEVYFVQSIGPLAKDTYAGRLLVDDLHKSFRYEEGATLFRKILSEFRWDHNGVYLPPGLIVKTFEPNRIHRVVWKIVRGLFFFEKKYVLPEHTLRAFEIYTCQNQPPVGPTMYQLQAAKGHTKHPSIFDYKFVEATSEDGHVFHVWALLFWNALMWLAVFHDPVCTCSGCIKLRASHPIQSLL